MRGVAAQMLCPCYCGIKRFLRNDRPECITKRRSVAAAAGLLFICFSAQSCRRHLWVVRGQAVCITLSAFRFNAIPKDSFGMTKAEVTRKCEQPVAAAMGLLFICFYAQSCRRHLWGVRGQAVCITLSAFRFNAIPKDSFGMTKAEVTRKCEQPVAVAATFIASITHICHPEARGIQWVALSAGLHFILRDWIPPAPFWH
jgi:hypothetical protein